MDEARLYDRVYACWLGKNIGGTLGAPVEGRMEEMNITFYPRLPQGVALPNDDLDLQLVALHALEAHGTALTAADIAAEWTEHVYFPWDEYGYASTAMRLGFIPPFSGAFDNPFTDCMGAPIRSEIWSAVCAGDPQAAASFALRDAAVDHAGGEGVWGEVFNAAAGAVAFECDDIGEIIGAALECVPPKSRVAGAVRLALALHRRGASLSEARAEILKRFGSPNFTDAPQNIAFWLCGILWGENFEDAILKTVNLGYDTDCTVATAGALLGIMHGRSYIPEKWSAPIGSAVAVSPQIRGFRAPADLDDLTRRTLRLRERLLLCDRGTLSGGTACPPDDAGAQLYTLPRGAAPATAVSVALRYLGEPFACPGSPCRVRAELHNNTSWRWLLEPCVVCPEGFSASECAPVDIPAGGGASFEFEITAHDPAEPDGGARTRENRFALCLDRINDGAYWAQYRLPFCVLTPNVWLLDGTETPVAGATVRFGADSGGEHTAECILTSPLTRQTRIFCNSRRPVRLELDGRVLFDAPGALYLPAYHRIPSAQRAETELAAGSHTVRITLGAGSPEDAANAFFTFGTVAPGKVGEPGNHYAYIDNIIRSGK